MRELVCSIALFAVAAGYYFAASGLSRNALSDEVGPAGLPSAYALVLAAIAIIMGLAAGTRIVLRRLRSESASSLKIGFMLRRAGGVLGIGIGFLLIVTVLGYFLATTVMLAAMLLYEGERPGLRVALAACGGAAVLWLLFDRVLGVPMPGLWGS